MKAIINANCVNATAFGVVGQHLDSRIIPESYVFLRDVGHVTYEEATSDPAAVAERSGPSHRSPSSTTTACWPAVRVCWLRSIVWKSWRQQPKP